MALLAFGTLAFGAVEAWSRFVLEAGTALLLALWAFWVSRSRSSRMEWNPVLTPLLIFGAFGALQWISGMTSYVYATRVTLQVLAMYFGLAFLASQFLRDRGRASQFVIFCAVFGAAFALFATLQWFTSPDKLYWYRVPRLSRFVFGSYVNRNHYSGMIELLLGFPLVLSLGVEIRRSIRVLAAFSALLMMTSVVLSGSRGGMVAITAEVVFALVLLLRDNGSRTAAVSLLAVLVITLGAGYWLGGASVLDRLASIGRVVEGSSLVEETRPLVLRDSLGMWKEKPVLGWGLGTFDATYPSHQSFHSSLNMQFAHDDFLQVLVEMGLIGFGLIVWFVFVLYRRALRGMDHWRVSLRRMLPVAALLGCTGLLVHSFTDFNLEIPANGAWFFVLAAAACIRVPGRVMELDVATPVHTRRHDGRHTLPHSPRGR